MPTLPTRVPGRLICLRGNHEDGWLREALAAAFEARNLNATYRVVPGPHDQIWLREAGSVETLHWLDRLAPA